ncbi:MAG: hypothetical protein HWN68_06510 [Desulfobacterales bacterium]|nr:hypothetical protein [Desulfobacterales bacterium]
MSKEQNNKSNKDLCFLSKHKKADEIIYDLHSMTPKAAIYFSPVFREQKHREELIAMLRAFIAKEGFYRLND